ncbi:peptidoglycan-binding protein [Streptomyces sp.]|uniref:peptidoglycan-binding protein n=1 Tax=Streptomyces sp. TaxID=1931 RepID=UPI002F4142BD
MRLGRLSSFGAASVTLIITMLLCVLTTQAPAHALPAWPSISQGAGGADTTTVQYLLRQHGHGIPADGQFGPVTTSAVVSFQSSRGLVADGVVGPQTWPYLIVPVQQGSSGEAVRAAQTQLNKYGFGLGVDGNFGSVTNSAVRSFQSSHGLAVDGLVGPQTWQSLLGSSGGGSPSGHALPLDRSAVPRSAYAAPHWNSTPAVDLIVSYLPAYAVKSGVAQHYSSTSCGTGVRLLQPDGSRFVYCHLSARSTANGAQVPAGTRLGTTGDTGNSGAPHLHIEIRTSDGLARCPQSYLLAIYDGLQPPSLTSLPTSGCTAA